MTSPALVDEPREREVPLWLSGAQVNFRLVADDLAMLDAVAEASGQTRSACAKTIVLAFLSGIEWHAPRAPEQPGIPNPRAETNDETIPTAVSGARPVRTDGRCSDCGGPTRVSDGQWRCMSCEWSMG